MMLKFMKHRWVSLGTIAMVAFVLQACGNIQPKAEYPDELADRYAETGGSVLGSPGFKLFDDQQSNTDTGGGGLAVNAYLWRATLDTLSFMPMLQVDPFGGVIITDWHDATQSGQERMKINGYILGRELRANGIRISVFRQVRASNGEWIDAAVKEEVATKLEDAVLTRARQLRIASNAPQK